MSTHTPANSVFDGPTTNLLSVLCILREILSHAIVIVKKEKGLNDFKSGTFIASFQSDGTVASMAVKGLKPENCSTIMHCSEKWMLYVFPDKYTCTCTMYGLHRTLSMIRIMY